MTIGKVIGVEGFSNSGKTSVIRDLAKDLLLRDGKIREIFRGVKKTEGTAKILDEDCDFTIVIELDGKIIVIVSEGDNENIVKRVRKILEELGIDVDILVVAMRIAFPAVGKVYRHEFGRKLKVVFKPGVKRWKEVPEEARQNIDELWRGVILQRMFER